MSTPAGTVLVVDDTESKRYVTSQWLRRAGYQVLETATGTEALEVCLRLDLDLVVLDVHLPDLSGLEVCRRLRSSPATAGLPVLHISAVATEPGDRSAGLDQGADAYLVDPIDPGELVSTAAALVRQGRARGAAERLADQLGRLGAAALGINGASTSSELVRAAAEGGAAVLGAPALVIAVREGGGWSAASAAPGEPTRTDPAAGRPAPSAERLKAVVAAMAGVAAPTRVDPASAGWAWALPTALAQTACLVVPVLTRQRSLLAAVVVPASAVPGPAEELLVEHLALVMGVALENRRSYAEEHQIALGLQRSLLPDPRPHVRGLQVSARYTASSERAEVGGDFFDAFELADGRAVVVVGDVQGHSLQAAAVMGGLRHSLRALAHEGHVGTSLVARLDRLLDREHPDLTATVCIVVVDAARTSAVVVNAGHIPPLLLVGGEVTVVEEHLPLLGVGLVRAQLQVPEPPVVELPPGARLLMVTDGLVERRGTHLGDGIAALAVTAGEHAGHDLEAFADAIMARHGEGAQDDAALIAVQTDDVRGPAAR